MVVTVVVAFVVTIVFAAAVTIAVVGGGVCDGDCGGVVLVGVESCSRKKEKSVSNCTNKATNK